MHKKLEKFFSTQKSFGFLMQKRGQSLGINTIIVAILALVVLVILILLISGQIRKSSKSYTGIGEQAEKELSQSSCEGGLLKVRKCARSEAELSNSFYWYETGDAGCGPDLRCFERGEPKQG